MVNAEQTTRTLLERFEVAGIVVTSVAGTTRRIGVVGVPVAWALKDRAGEWETDAQCTRELLPIALERGDAQPTPLA